MATYNADIVIYGGSMAGVAAAAKAAANAPTKRIVVIVPDTSGKLGGLGTVGGQNFFDRRTYEGTDPQGGTYAYWFSKFGRFYGTAQMAAELAKDLEQYQTTPDRMRILFARDIEDYGKTLSPFRITSLALRSIYRDAEGLHRWGTETDVVTGSVFIDASDDGRLARLVNFGGTTGRYDWPADRLDADETTSPGRGRQQAATLMISMTNIEFNVPTTDHMEWVTDERTGTRGIAGGWYTYQDNPVVRAFNDKYGPLGYAIKPFNAAQDGPGSPHYWVNILLTFNVDGRVYTRDEGFWRYPTDKRPEYKAVDRAWVDTRNFIKNTPEFMNAVRQFPGMRNAQLMDDGYGYPVVGEVLYLRETIHNSIDATRRAPGTENSNYQITTSEAVNAGAGPGVGSDQGNYASRVALNFYQSDINGYKFTDLRDPNGYYRLGSEITRNLRPDIGITSPTNPVYVPYQALTTNYVANLLNPTYAISTPAYAWAEIRVLPNLIANADAAGVAAAHAANIGKDPLYFTQTDIASVQNTLVTTANAKLEK